MHLNRKNGSRDSLAMQLVGTLLARKSVFIVHCISQVLIVCRLRTAFLMHRAKIEKEQRNTTKCTARNFLPYEAL